MCDKEIFAHERLRVQLAAILILAGCTSTRPGTLIGQLLYKYVEFQVFPPPCKGKRPRIAMKINLEHVKRSAGQSDPKIFAFHEEEMLLHCPLLHMMALAFADKVFENGFSTLEGIYKLVVGAKTDRVRLLWKDEWRERPIFRDVRRTPKGALIAADKALQYAKVRQHFIRLGRSCGYANKLEFYDLRRASGKKLNGVSAIYTDAENR